MSALGVLNFLPVEFLPQLGTDGSVSSADVVPTWVWRHSRSRKTCFIKTHVVAWVPFSPLSTRRSSCWRESACSTAIGVYQHLAARLPSTPAQLTRWALFRETFERCSAVTAAGSLEPRSHGQRNRHRI